MSNDIKISTGSLSKSRVSAKRFYLRCAIYPSVVVLMLSIVSCAIGNRDYKSEWLTAGAVNEIVFIFTLIHCLIMCFLMIPILFSENPLVQDSAMLTLTCWLLPPLAYGAWAYQAFAADPSLEQKWLMIFFLPYFYSLGLNFWHYSKQRKPTEG